MCADQESGEYLAEKFEPLLGKVSVCKGCVRFTKLENVDRKGLVAMLKAAEEIGVMAKAG